MIFMKIYYSKYFIKDLLLTKKISRLTFLLLLAYYEVLKQVAYSSVHSPHFCTFSLDLYREGDYDIKGQSQLYGACRSNRTSINELGSASIYAHELGHK